MRSQLHLPARARVLLPVLVLTTLALASSARGDLTWTSSAAFVSQPGFIGGAAGTLSFGGIPGTSGPTITDTANGFTFTDFQIIYKAAAADVSRNIKIEWVISRNFTSTGGPFSDTSTIAGSATLTLNPGGGALIAGVGLGTYHSGEPQASLAVAPSGSFTLDANNLVQNFANTKTVNFTCGGGAEMLVQQGDIVVNPSAAGQTVNFSFPGSADSDTVPTPEPSTWISFGAGAIALCLWARRGGPVRASRLQQRRSSS
jgi:hypothetical protein